MKKRPPIVYVLVGICALFPVIMIFQTALVSRVGLAAGARSFLWPERPLLFGAENLVATALAWMVAAAVYQVRARSWWLLLGLTAAWAARDVYVYVTQGQAVSEGALWAFTTVTLLPLAALALALQRETRAPYFNPRIRWWESEPRYPFDAQVRSGGRALDISDSGVFIQHDAPRKMGARDDYVLEMKESELAFRGEVCWVSAGDAEHPAGYGVKFVELTAAARQEIRGILERQKKLGQKEWGERAVRYPTDIHCGDGQIALDISQGGMFVRSEVPRRLGDTAIYQLQFGKHDISVTGEVVWLSQGDQKYPPGHGVKFVHPDPDTRAMLSALVYDHWLARQAPVPRQV